MVNIIVGADSIRRVLFDARCAAKAVTRRSTPSFGNSRLHMYSIVGFRRWTSVMFQSASSTIWRVYDEGVDRANTSHEEVPWLSEFADCGAPVAPLRVATIGYVHSAFSDEPLCEIGISFTDVNVADTVGVAE